LSLPKKEVFLQKEMYPNKLRKDEFRERSQIESLTTNP